MPGLARIALLATAIVLAVAVGACGGQQDSSAKNDYVKQVNAAQTRFASAAKSAGQQITRTSSASQDRRTLDRFGSTIEDLVVTLRAIKAPTDVRGEHGRLVAAMTGHRDEVARATARLRSPTTRELAEVQRQLSAATITVNADLSSATGAINAKLRAR